MKPLGSLRPDSKCAQGRPGLPCVEGSGAQAGIPAFTAAGSQGLGLDQVGALSWGSLGPMWRVTAPQPAPFEATVGSPGQESGATNQVGPRGHTGDLPANQVQILQVC